MVKSTVKVVTVANMDSKEGPNRLFEKWFSLGKMEMSFVLDAMEKFSMRRKCLLNMDLSMFNASNVLNAKNLCKARQPSKFKIIWHANNAVRTTISIVVKSLLKLKRKLILLRLWILILINVQDVKEKSLTLKKCK